MRQWALPQRPVTGPASASTLEVAIELPDGTVAEEDGGHVTFVARRTRLQRGDLAHGWRPVDDGVALVVSGVTSALVHVLVRVPGEHRLGDANPVAEVQLRFAADEGPDVTLAVPVVRGPRPSVGVASLLEGTVDVRALLLHPRHLSTYAGHLTVPPFDEPTTWMVAERPLTLSDDQLAGLTAPATRALPGRAPQAITGWPVVRLHARVLSVYDDLTTGDVR